MTADPRADLPPPSPYDALFDADWATVKRASSQNHITTRDLVHIETLLILTLPNKRTT